MSRIVAAHNVPALAQAEWFAFTANPYYAHLADRPSVYSVRIHETVNGEFYVNATYSDAHKGSHTFFPGHRSNAFATLAEAAADANRVWEYLRNEFVSEYGASAPVTVAVPWGGLDKGKRWTGDNFGRSPRMTDGQPGYSTRESYCAQCERFGTIVVTDTGYGWASDCPCGYHDYASSGD